ncbi:hypothetical protein C8T65DRAFT_726200 [Cerioporus squamosus]|nr:hypothetical protein C8T65DRAFT_726200 [Cerioporus squamosus]
MMAVHVLPSLPSFSEEEQIFAAMFDKYINVDGIQELPAPTDATAAIGVNSLPPEVMLKIFQALATASPANVRWDQQRVPTDWLVVNLVCQYWRRIACAFPILWRAIDVGSSVEWLQLCLARSGSAPLDVRLYDHRTLFQTAAILLKHAGRIRSLMVTQDAAGDALHALGSLFMVGMPALEELYLDADKPDAPFLGKCLHDVFLLDRKSERTFPSLRTLHLDALYLPPTRSILQGLRVLELTNSRPETSAREVTFTEFLDALDACPTLEELKLWNSLPFCICDDCSDADEADRVVALPNLRTLSLFCLSDFGDVGTAVETTRCRHFLSHLRLPEHTETVLYAPTRHEERKSFLNHLPNDPACLPILRTADEATLKGAWNFTASTRCPCAKCAEMDSQLVHTHADADEWEEEEEDAADSDRDQDTHRGSLTMYILNPCGCPSGDGVAEEDAAAREFAELFAAAPLRRLEVFYGTSQVGFGHLFSSFHGLSALMLQCCGHATETNMRDFVRALAGPSAARGTDVSGERAGENAPLPQLRWLCIHGACWYRGLAQDLEACLRAREVKGASKLYELHVELCSGSAKGRKGRKLDKKRAKQLSALAPLVERPIQVHFGIIVSEGDSSGE